MRASREHRNAVWLYVRLTPSYRDVEEIVVCAAALAEDRQSWTDDPLFGSAVAEVERRKLERDECIHLAGTQPLARVKPTGGPMSAAQGPWFAAPSAPGREVEE